MSVDLGMLCLIQNICYFSKQISKQESSLLATREYYTQTVLHVWLLGKIYSRSGDGLFTILVLKVAHSLPIRCFVIISDE